MKTIQDIQEEIISSMMLEDPQRSIEILAEVYGMHATLSEGLVHHPDADITYPIEVHADFMRHIVKQATLEELLDNYQQLSGQEWEWHWNQDESDCQPEPVLRNKHSLNS